MDWNAISAIGEILGAIAVVISLGYLARQIRYQNKQSKLDAMHEILAEFRVTTTRMSQDDLATIWAKALDGIDDLSKVERIKLLVAVASIMRAWEEAYIRYESGNLDTRIWETMDRHYSFLRDAAPFAWAWERRKKLFDKGFQEYVDNMERQEYEL